MNCAFYLLLINAITVAVYWIDKRAARARGWRIPEASLLLLGFLGGWPAGLLAMQTLRHKTRKTSFQLKFWLLVVIQVGVIVVRPSPLEAIVVRLLGIS